MERIRKPFQGVSNIVRFNWHFYAISVVVLLLLSTIIILTDSWYTFYITIAATAIITTTVISFAVSFYVYDLSNLYSLNWLRLASVDSSNTIVNINAGFDETSILLKANYPGAELIVFDFYDPQKHTEVSIKRARMAYSPFPDTKVVTTASLPLTDNCIDTVCLILSAHEIRSENERIHFFKEIKRVTKPTGKIIVTEHLQDLPNFLAYNIGFFHFHSKATWYRTFKQAGFQVNSQIKITPFITTFILEKNGTTS